MRRKRLVVLFWMMLLLAVVTIIWAMKQASKLRKQKEEKAAPLLPYRTIDSGERNLYAYTLHKESEDQYKQVYSAVIRSIDPAKDNYKAYCRRVVADIIKTAGTDKLWINIYDDGGVCDLVEQRYTKEFAKLTKDQEDSVARHTVANFLGDVYHHDGARFMIFYGEAGNNYSSKEAY